MMLEDGIIVGDKLIQFSEVTTAKTQGTVAPGADAINVRGIRYAGVGPDGWEYGLQFNGGWSAGGLEIADTTLHFSVEIIEPELSDGWLIHDNSLGLSAYAVSDTTNGGIVSVSENVYVADPALVQPGSPDNEPVANKFAYYRTDDDKDLFDEAEFAPVPKIWIIKDVVANGGDLTTGVAHLSEFTQTFSQVPEPATMTLLGLGGLGVLLRRRRR
ncbi:MAG: PEP-CTERM sorting domain-containing protein [Phycisphaerae bacterium]|nr:PEP-CTERM sorting domain-containing protein [Phycisphaerae bacterium]